MDMKLLAQAAIMLATIAGGYAVVKAQLARVMSDLEDYIKRSEAHRNKFDMRLDDAESQRAVFASRIDVLADINSVKALAELNTRLARLEMVCKLYASPEAMLACKTLRRALLIWGRTGTVQRARRETTQGYQDSNAG